MLAPESRLIESEIRLAKARNSQLTSSPLKHNGSMLTLEPEHVS